MIDFTNGQILTGEDYADSYIANHRKNVTPIDNIPMFALDNAWQALRCCSDVESMEVKEKYHQGYQRVKASQKFNGDETTKHISTDPTNSKVRQKKPSKTSSLKTLSKGFFFYKKMSHVGYDRCGHSDAIMSQPKLRKMDNPILIECDDISPHVSYLGALPSINTFEKPFDYKGYPLIEYQTIIS